MTEPDPADSSAAEKLTVPPEAEAAYVALHPFLPCAPDEAEREDYLSATRVLTRSIQRNPAPEITKLVQEVGIDRINGRGTLTYKAAIKALDRLVSIAPQIKPVVSTIKRDWINAAGALPYEAVIETLEYAADYIAIEPPEAGIWLRALTEQELTKRFGREMAGALLRRYVDPDPPGEAPYDEGGILRSVDLADRRTVPWLADGMIQAGTVGMWIAPFSSGKTFGAISLGLALAFERDWLGRETNGGGHVRYIAAEGLASFDRRLAGWLVHHDHLPERFTRKDLADALEGRFSLSGGTLRLDDPRLEEVLVRTIREDESRLLVLDTLGRLLGVGQSDEDNAVANSVMGVLHRVAGITGCTILVTHHPGHTQRHRARGASAWAQAADWVMVSKGNLRSGSPVRLVNTKQRDAELFPDTAYRLRSLPDIECDGEGWSTAVFEAAPVASATEIPLPLRIRMDVQAHPGSSLREIRARVKGRANDIGDEIIRLVSADKLINKGSGNTYSLHDNPDEWEDDPVNEFSADADSAPDLSDLTATEG